MHLVEYANIIEKFVLMMPHHIIKQEKIPLSLPIIKYPVIVEIHRASFQQHLQKEIKHKQGRTKFAINETLSIENSFRKSVP